MPSAIVASTLFGPAHIQQQNNDEKDDIFLLEILHDQAEEGDLTNDEMLGRLSSCDKVTSDGENKVEVIKGGLEHHR